MQCTYINLSWFINGNNCSKFTQWIKYKISNTWNCILISLNWISPDCENNTFIVIVVHKIVLQVSRPTHLHFFYIQILKYIIGISWHLNLFHFCTEKRHYMRFKLGKSGVCSLCVLQILEQCKGKGRWLKTVRKSYPDKRCTLYTTFGKNMAKHNSWYICMFISHKI